MTIKRIQNKKKIIVEADEDIVDESDRRQYAKSGANLHLYVIFEPGTVRFDDTGIRGDRVQIDKTASIREVFKVVNQNCKIYYSVG